MADLNRYMCRQTGKQSWFNNMQEAEASMCWNCPMLEECEGLKNIATDDIWSELMGGSEHEQRTESVGNR